MSKAHLNFYYWMDGIKKRPIPSISETQKSENMQPVIPLFPKREELYIPKEETLQDVRHERAFQKGRLVRKIAWAILFILVAAMASYAIFFSWKAQSVIKKMSASPSAQTTLVQNIKSVVSPIIPSASKHLLRGEETGRVNILLLGAAGEKKPGGNLTDTVMIMSVDTKNKKVALLSLPRDFYVQIPDSNSFTKLNSLYKIGISQQKGADMIKEAVEKITGVKINYHVAVDFDAFQKIVDNIGGINVISERDIYDPTYPGPNYSYETFSLSKGAHLLDGATALKYVRERHDDPEGDFGRAKRQQQVIQAVKNKMFSMQTFFNVIALNKVLDTLGDNIKTDMAFEDIEQFIKLSKAVDTQNINNAVVDAWKPESLLKVSHVMLGNDRAFILVPRIGNYSEIQDLAQNIFDQTEIKRRQQMIKSENASIVIINQSDNAELAKKIKRLLIEKLDMKNVREVSNESGEMIATSTVSGKTSAEKIFTLDELIKKLPAKLGTQETDSEHDIVIRLGNDLTDVYKYEEDSIEDFNKAQDNQEVF
ncbi:MAG: putative transcription regulator [uncultured bacterium]|nr:MAG: putative transcription regulator [uncultured bacterium]